MRESGGYDNLPRNGLDDSLGRLDNGLRAGRRSRSGRDLRREGNDSLRDRRRDGDGHRLDARGELEALPEKLKETARLRTENPESNLAELAALFDPPLTKSALNHRLRKLCELGKE